jgi:hypothetical protein
LPPINTVGFVTYFIEDMILTRELGRNKSPEIPFIIVTGIIWISGCQSVPINKDIDTKLACPIYHFSNTTLPITGIGVISLFVDVHGNSNDINIPLLS